MVGRAAAVLVGRPAVPVDRVRAAVLVVALGLLTAWGAGAGVLPEVGTRLDVVVIAALVMPVTFLVCLLVLPLAGARGLLPVAVALGLLAGLLHLADAGSLFNVAKLLALVLAGFWFLQLFEALSWIVLVAVLIPWVDAFSVWRGPTDYVVNEKPSLFEQVSIAFRLPGEDASANLGPPDVLFFALFLATASRFGLRVGWTWAGMTAGLVLTLVVTAAFDIGGLPALPAISLGFLAANADRLWIAWRERGLEPSGR